MIESPAGAVKAADMPLMKRVAMSRFPSCARPPRSDAATKTPREIKKTRRRPRRSAARPPSRRKPPYPSTYALTTHCSELVERPRSLRIDGRATPTIDTSSASRKRAPQSTSSAPQARLLSRPEPSSREWDSCEVVAVTKKLLPVSSQLADRAPLSYCSTSIVHISSIEVKQLIPPELQSRDDHAPDLAAVDVLTVLQALSDPVRLAIVRQLAGCGEAGLMCGQIQLRVGKSTASHHLKTLHNAGITSERAQGVCKYIQLRRDELDERFPGLMESVLSAPGAPAV